MNVTCLKLIANEKQDNRRYSSEMFVTVHLILSLPVSLGIYMRRNIPAADVKDYNTQLTK
jgi:hypothetical protein